MGIKEKDLLEIDELGDGSVCDYKIKSKDWSRNIKQVWYKGGGSSGVPWVP